MLSRPIVSLLVAFLVLRLVFWFATFPNPDEAYYWLWGQQPGFSYYDHPPLLAWIQGLFTAVLERSAFTLRLPNLFSNTLFFYTYYQITRYLYGDKAQQFFWFVLLLVFASPLYFLFLALAWHDHLLITLSLVSAYWFIRFLDSYLVNGRGESWRLYGAAAAIGLAILSKYNAVFVLMGFAATVLTDKRLHPLWRDRRIYLAMAIMGSALIPIVLWNLSNDFQSFRYYVNRSVDSGSQLRLLEPISFLLISILILSPVNSIAVFRVLRRDKPIKPNSTYETVAIWVFAISTLILLAISLVSTALYYWNITAYLLLFPLLPTVLLKHEPDGVPEIASSVPLKSRVKPLFWGGQFYGLLFAVLLVVHYSVLPLSALVSRDADPDSRMLLGWRDVETAIAAKAREFKQSPLLITTDYRSASALAYQLKDSRVAAISDRIDQFDFWYPNQAAFKGRDAILLFDDWHPAPAKLLAQFEQTSEPTIVPITRFGIWIKNYYLLQGYQFKSE